MSLLTAGATFSCRQASNAATVVRHRLVTDATTWRDAARDSRLPLPAAAAVASVFSLVLYALGEELG